MPKKFNPFLVGNFDEVGASGGGGGTGDVVGPASAVDNNVALFDGTTGKLIKDSGLTLSGSNTGDQTSIVGITGTKAQFDTAVTDGNILYVGDVTQYTDEMAQDAVGAMVDASLTYVDGTPLLQRAALTGDVTASAGSNATTIANDAVTYAKMQNVSATGKLLGRSTAGAGDVEEITLGTNLSFSGTTLNAAGGGGGSATEIEVDFGSGAPLSYASFTITDAAVSGTSKIVCTPSGNVATGRVGNDYEWDAIYFTAVAGIGQFTLSANVLNGGVVGNRKLFYSVF